MKIYGIASAETYARLQSEDVNRRITNHVTSVTIIDSDSEDDVLLSWQSPAKPNAISSPHNGASMKKADHSMQKDESMLRQGEIQIRGWSNASD